MAFEYGFTDRIGTRATLGLVVLRSDETIEHDMRRLLPNDDVALYATRIHCDTDVTGDTLAEMEEHLPNSVGLFPPRMSFDAVGYGCTSGASVIGPGAVADLVKASCDTKSVTEPVSALIAACAHLGIRKLAFLSPYVEEVSATLMNVIAKNGIDSPVFGSFDEGNDQNVARIDPKSIYDAAVALAARGDCDAVFMSCTNLRTLDIIPAIEAEIGKPVLSSNQVLGWHLARLAQITPNPGFGRLFSV